MPSRPWILYGASALDLLWAGLVAVYGDKAFRAIELAWLSPLGRGGAVMVLVAIAAGGIAASLDRLSRLTRLCCALPQQFTLWIASLCVLSVIFGFSGRLWPINAWYQFFYRVGQSSPIPPGYESAFATIHLMIVVFACIYTGALIERFRR